ncbi:MAG: hypothetical protein JSR90_04230 [Proteobacteria bacterium]|nr:hypothetical protein [Pseudomonadota bacterium]
MAAAVAHQAFGTLDSRAYMQSGMAGAGLGIILGLVSGVWLVSRDQGSQAGPALAWLWVGASIVLLSLAWVVTQ